MKLISKFNDYYDIGISYGIDPNVVYQREETEIVKSDVLNYIGLNATDTVRYIDLVSKMTAQSEVFSETNNWFAIFGMNPNCIVMGFCGWWYFGVVLPSKGYIDTIVYWDKSDRAIDEIEKKYWNDRWEGEKKDALRFLKKKPVYNIDPFIHFETPIIFLDNKSRKSENFLVYKDINLSEYGFANVVDPWTAFQEVNMFVTGIMGQSIPSTVQVSDTDLRDAKGFDNMSFKKPKQKRK